MGPVGMTIFVATVPTSTTPTGVRLVGSTNRDDAKAWLLHLPEEEQIKNLHEVPIVGLLFKAESYDSFQHVASDVMWMFEQAGFGKKGQPNTFWAMTKAAIDELLEKRRQLAAVEPALAAARELADSNHKLHLRISELETRINELKHK